MSEQDTKWCYHDPHRGYWIGVVESREEVIGDALEHVEDIGPCTKEMIVEIAKACVPRFSLGLSVRGVLDDIHGAHYELGEFDEDELTTMPSPAPYSALTIKHCKRADRDALAVHSRACDELKEILHCAVDDWAKSHGYEVLTFTVGEVEKVEVVVEFGEDGYVSSWQEKYAYDGAGR